MDQNRSKQILMGVGYGFGAAGALAPTAVLRTFGYRDASGEQEALMRAYSLRNIALASVLQLTNDETQIKRFHSVAAGLFAADTISTLWAAVRGKTSWRATLSLMPISAGLAALAAAGADIG